MTPIFVSARIMKVNGKNGVLKAMSWPAIWVRNISVACGLACFGAAMEPAKQGVETLSATLNTPAPSCGIISS